MHHKIPTYIRTHRRRWGLTQRDLAHLFGSKSASQISRWEKLARLPTLRFAFTCQIIFGEVPHNMFPKHFSEIEEAVTQRASELEALLEESVSQASKRKRELLHAVLRRARDSRSSVLGECATSAVAVK